MADIPLNAKSVAQREPSGDQAANSGPRGSTSKSSVFRSRVVPDRSIRDGSLCANSRYLTHSPSLHRTLLRIPDKMHGTRSQEGKTS